MPGQTRKSAPATTPIFPSGGKVLDLRLWHWTDDVAEALAAEAAGVDRIGLDIERLGKAERQAGLASWISPHELSALPALRATLGRAQLFVRVNMLHPGSAAEVEHCLAEGVDVLMLPNFVSHSELACFVDLVAGRAIVVPLVERRAALNLIADFRSLGISEFHVGLNDLALDLGVANRLDLLTSVELQSLSRRAQALGLRYGIGGVARPSDRGLPVDPAAVIAQYVRLGSTGAMLARSMRVANLVADGDLSRAVAEIRACFAVGGVAAG